MPERDEIGRPDVMMFEVERVAVEGGTFSIYQALGVNPEAVDVFIEDQKTKGRIFGTPESFEAHVALRSFDEPPIEVVGTDLNYRTILVGPPLFKIEKGTLSRFQNKN